MIVADRLENGKFLSIVDFDNRVGGRKNEIENLILCGAFDNVEGVKDVFDRFTILEKFYANRGTAQKDKKELEIGKNCGC